MTLFCTELKWMKRGIKKLLKVIKCVLKMYTHPGLNMYKVVRCWLIHCAFILPSLYVSVNPSQASTSTENSNSMWLSVPAAQGWELLLLTAGYHFRKEADCFGKMKQKYESDNENTCEKRKEQKKTFQSTHCIFTLLSKSSLIDLEMSWIL